MRQRLALADAIAAVCGKLDHAAVHRAADVADSRRLHGANESLAFDNFPLDHLRCNHVRRRQAAFLLAGRLAQPDQSSRRRRLPKSQSRKFGLPCAVDR